MAGHERIGLAQVLVERDDHVRLVGRLVEDQVRSDAGGQLSRLDAGERGERQHVGVDGHARHLLELGDDLGPRASEAAPALSPLVGPLEGDRGTGHASDEVAGYRRGGTGGEGPRRQGSE